MDYAGNVVVLAFRGTRVAGCPLTVREADHACATMLAPQSGGDDGFFAIHLGLTDEDEAAGAKEAHITDVTDFVLVLLGGAAENEFDAVDVDEAMDRQVSIRFDSLLLTATSVEMNGAELVVVAILPTPHIEQLVLRLELCDDGCDDLFLACLNRNECQGCQPFFADDFHF